MTTALIDGDVLVYRCGFAGQKVWYTVRREGNVLEDFQYKKDANTFVKENKDEELVIVKEDPIVEPIENVLHSVKVMMKSILNVIGEDYLLYLGGPNNFRLDIDPEYKANRKDKPIHYEAIRQYMIDVWNAQVTDGIETDDALGLAQTSDTCICSIDKDLLMVPGKHYNFVKDEYINITKDEGIRKFYTQLITGDMVDNIIGLEGYGPVKATKALEECETEEDMWEVVQDLYDPDWQKLGNNMHLLYIRNNYWRPIEWEQMQIYGPWV